MFVGMLVFYLSFFATDSWLKLKQKTCQKQGSQQIFGPSCFVTALIPKIALKFFSINADRFGKITICHHLKSIFYVNSHLNLSDFSELRMSKKYFNAIFAIVSASFFCFPWTWWKIYFSDIYCEKCDVSIQFILNIIFVTFLHPPRNVCRLGLTL